MPRVLRALACALLAVPVLAACSGTDAVNQDTTANEGHQIGNSSVVSINLVAPGKRKAAGDVHGATLTGEQLSLASLRGKVVVVDIWESDCAPCREEAAYLEQIAKDDAAEGVAVVGIDVGQDTVTNAVAFNRAHHVTYPSIFDPSGDQTLLFPGVIPDTTPTLVVLDRQGRVAAGQSGGFYYTSLKALVDRVTSEQA